MNSFPCMCRVSRRTNAIISQELLWSLSFCPVCGDQLISPDFPMVVGAADRETTARAAESRAMLSRRQSKQIGNRSLLPLSLLILPFPCAVFVVYPAYAPPPPPPPPPSLSLSLSLRNTRSVGKQIWRDLPSSPRISSASRGHPEVESADRERCNAMLL